MRNKELAPGLFLLDGAVNTGTLVVGSKALLFDCCDSVTPKRLAGLGVRSVARILCTQHRRTNVAGAYAFVEKGAQLVAPETERPLFDDVTSYWSDWHNRWHLYHQQPGPQVLARPIAVARTVHEGDTIEWEGHTIRVMDTPGATDGSVSYILEAGGKTFCFCGDAIYGPGQLWDVYSLQKGFGVIGDYHGFLGNRRKLVPSLHKLAALGAATLVPSHGAPIVDSASATALLEQRLDALWRNYTAISALNHYFPSLFDDTKNDPQRMKPAATSDPPDWVRRVAFTSFALVSETGAALLIDCGNDSVIDTLGSWIAEKKITKVEGCWITHYHDDHVDALHRAAVTLRCPIMTDEHLAEIIEHPQRFLLPCISPCCAPVAKATRDAESWQWHEFKLTAYHFPGQTLYHSGLLAEGHGKKVFFAGDSGAPTGLDDYTAGNRTFLGAHKGFRRCIEIWRECRPDYIFNQHQDRPFAFSQEQLDYMDAMLAKRERLLAEMVPWDNPNCGLDEWWVRAYPAEQDSAPGAAIAVDVQFTNHGTQPVVARVEPVLPAHWKSRAVSAHIPAQTDGAANVRIHLPEIVPAGRYVIPFRVTWNDRCLGQFRHAIVVVR